MRVRTARARFRNRPPGSGQSFQDPIYDQLEARYEQQYGIPRGLIGRIRTRGERSNANQVSEAGARSVYQFIPETRNAFVQRYGVDPWRSPAEGAHAAALHLVESHRRHGDWGRAVTEYHGGTDPANWGPRTRAYTRRVRGP